MKKLVASAGLIFLVCFCVSAAIGNSGVDSVNGVSSEIVFRDTSTLLFVINDFRNASSPETCDVSLFFKNFRFQNVNPDGSKFMDVKTYTPLLLRGDKASGILIFVEYGRNGVFEGTMTYMSLHYEKNAETLNVKIDTIKSEYQSRFGPNFKVSWISFVSSGFLLVYDYSTFVPMSAVVDFVSFSGAGKSKTVNLGNIGRWLGGDSLSGLGYENIVDAQSYSKDSVVVKVSYGKVSFVSDSVTAIYFQLGDNTGMTIRANKLPLTKIFYSAPRAYYNILGRTTYMNRAAIGLNIIRMQNGTTVRKMNFNRLR